MPLCNRNVVGLCALILLLLAANAIAQIPSTSQLKAESITPQAQTIRTMDQILQRRGSVTFRDTAIAEVIYTLSQQWNVNIVAGADVTGTVSGSFREFNNATTATTNNLVSNSSIQYKDISLKLEVLPLINSDKDVSLEIVQNISERSGTTKIDNNDIPNIARRAIKTYVTVPNNGTLILGGLIKESFDMTKSGIPKLVNLPLIGALFGKTTKAKVRNELIIIMRPVVTLAQGETAILREKTFDSLNVPADLEGAIMPQNIRERIPPAKPAPLRSPAPKLREDTNSARKR